MDNLLPSIPNSILIAVLTSIIGAVCHGILGFSLKSIFKKIRLKIKHRNLKFNTLTNKCKSPDYNIRFEAMILFIFNILKHFLLGNLVWILAESLIIFIESPILYYFKFLSLLFFYFGLKWVYYFKSAESTALKVKLVITQATYGLDEKQVDVTEELRKLIQDNTLTVNVSNNIAGDPYPGKVKTLTIYYKLDGYSHSDTYSEGHKLILPRPD